MRRRFWRSSRPSAGRADKTLRHVEGAWIQEQKVVVRDGKVAEYRVNMKISFVLAD